MQKRGGEKEERVRVCVMMVKMMMVSVTSIGLSCACLQSEYEIFDLLLCKYPIYLNGTTSTPERMGGMATHAGSGRKAGMGCWRMVGGDCSEPKWTAAFCSNEIMLKPCRESFDAGERFF